ncbi:MAG: amidohydrolase [Nocardioidaceae bacterium]
MPDETTRTNSLLSIADGFVPHLTELRRDLHAHPELAWTEVRSTDAVGSALSDGGVGWERLPRTGLVAEVGPPDVPLVALRADLDALPVPDTTQDPWRSQVDGVAHACGHDVHTAALVGAALSLREMDAAQRLPVRVRMVFQPAEEVMPGGGREVVAGGTLKGVRHVFAVHCDPTLDVGQVGLREGALTGAADSLTVHLSGRGGHTSRPHLTQDLTYALGVLVTQLPSALSRRLDPRAGASLVWGSLHAGRAANVIPATGELSGTLRMLDSAAWIEAEHLVRSLIADLVAPYGVGADVDYVRGVPPVINDAGATAMLTRATSAALGPQAATTTSQSLGGEDFAWYVEAVPGAMARLGTRTPAGPTYDLHQGDLRIDERSVGVAAKVLATVALLGA